MDPGIRRKRSSDDRLLRHGIGTYETALSFEAKGFGWSYGDKPTFVLTRRECRGPGIPSNSTRAISRSS